MRSILSLIWAFWLMSNCCYAVIAPTLQKKTSAASAKAISKQPVKVVPNISQ